MCIRDRKDTRARRLDENGEERVVSSSELRKGDVVMVTAGEIIPGAVSYTHLAGNRQG